MSTWCTLMFLRLLMIQCVACVASSNPGSCATSLIVGRVRSEADIDAALECLVKPIKDVAGIAGEMAVLGGFGAGAYAGGTAGAWAGSALGPFGAAAGAFFGGLYGGAFGGGGVLEVSNNVGAKLRMVIQQLLTMLKDFLKWLLLSKDSSPLCRALGTLGLPCSPLPPCPSIHQRYKAAARRAHPDREADPEMKARAEAEQTKLNLAMDVVYHYFGGRQNCTSRSDL
eukprot:TRINITY_DN76925_c0_g1_i1.p1 TRINITY_DN76925_c0_g1~~TRINITY_DN76925_c0_g1_i1.p1  ORF type:complete len:247 (+),score=35.75 TRINITY_DN76925_c0_g1_i1:62-742(+)